ncbi:MAG: hypothetical protein GY769_00275 [bacterium]|nr:hypothetical protein [bacterium]
MNRRSLLFLALAAATLHCAKAPEPELATLERVENAGLGVAIAELPEAFSVVNASGPTIELVAAGESGSGRAVVAAGSEETFGINLVEAVKERKAWFEEAPGGRYFGNRELGTPNGTAFTARGSYDGESGPVEETWVYTIHPAANRLLTITYTYPTGESEERVNQLLLLLGEIEGLAAEEPAQPE